MGFISSLQLPLCYRLVGEPTPSLKHLPCIKLFKTDRPAFDFLSFEEAKRMLNAANRSGEL